MALMFEPTSSWCYQFARYTVLPEVTREPEVASGQPFKMTEVARRVIARYLTEEQLAEEITAPESGKVHTVWVMLRHYVNLTSKVPKNSPFTWLGEGNTYRLKTGAETEIEMEEMAETVEDENGELEDDLSGYLYAFSFPVLLKSDACFPIKIGRTTGNVEERVAAQCRSSAVFEQPVVLGQWKVKRVIAAEMAVHYVLKARGKFRDTAPGTEWFDTTIAEIEEAISFVEK